jgi:glycosyltransferase involved in cell wall biosynthesis
VSAELAVLVPVLNRPQRVAPLLASIEASTPEAQVLFICDQNDHAEIEAIGHAGGKYIVHDGNYAQKIRAGIELTNAPLVFLGADDLTFQPGWFEAAKAAMADGVQVVGVNDLIERPNRPTHATHFLLSREAAELPCIDGSSGPLFEGYTHSATDDEFIATSVKRGIYAYAPDAHVEHLHWMNGRAEDDEVYRRGREHFRRDIRLFRRRSRLWTR